MVPIPPGLVSEMLAPVRSSAVSVLVRAFSMSSSKAALKLGEVLAARVADDGDHQRARAVLLLHVDRDAEVDLTVVDAMGLAVAVVEVVGHDRHVVLSRPGRWRRR